MLEWEMSAVPWVLLDDRCELLKRPPVARLWHQTTVFPQWRGGHSVTGQLCRTEFGLAAAMPR